MEKITSNARDDQDDPRCQKRFGVTPVDLVSRGGDIDDPGQRVGDGEHDDGHDAGRSSNSNWPGLTSTTRRLKDKERIGDATRPGPETWLWQEKRQLSTDSSNLQTTVQTTALHSGARLRGGGPAPPDLSL